jgi:hypothetical protein
VEGDRYLNEFAGIARSAFTYLGMLATIVVLSSLRWKDTDWETIEHDVGKLVVLLLRGGVVVALGVLSLMLPILLFAWLWP